MTINEIFDFGRWRWTASMARGTPIKLNSQSIGDAMRRLTTILLASTGWHKRETIRWSGNFHANCEEYTHISDPLTSFQTLGGELCGHGKWHRILVPIWSADATIAECDSDVDNTQALHNEEGFWVAEPHGRVSSNQNLDNESLPMNIVDPCTSFNDLIKNPSPKDPPI